MTRSHVLLSTGVLCVVGVVTGCSKSIPTSPVTPTTVGVTGISAVLSNDQYSFVALEPFSKESSQAVGINNRGDVVGTFGKEPENAIEEREGGYLYHDRKFSKIKYPNAISYGAQGINKGGVVVGYFADKATTGVLGPHDGFVLKGGSFTKPFAKLKGAPKRSQYSDVTFRAINDDGDIVGTVTTLDGYRGFRIRKGRFHLIDCGQSRTQAEGINNRGDVVGECDFDDAFLVHGGVFTVFDYPGAIETVARGINDDGLVVGSYAIDLDGADHGFIRDVNGNFTAIDFPDALETSLSGINKHGDLVGTYIDADGRSIGFVALAKH